MLLSVVVPVYNTEKYLNKCIESILKQTCEDLEILAIDDGSTDASPKILEEYKKRYPQKLRVIHQENHGIGYTRNRGIEEAKGKYIAFIDSDDFIEEKFCEYLCMKAEKEKLDIVVCDYYELSEITKSKKYIKIEEFETTDLSAVPRLLFEINSSPWNKVYRTEMLRENKIWFARDLKYEDVGFVLKAVAVAQSIGKTDQPLVNYLVREGSETKVMDTRVFDIFPVLDDLCIFFKRQDMFENVKEYLEWFCINRLMVYNIQQRYQKNRKDAESFVEKSFLYLDTNFSGWRENRCYVEKNNFLKRCIKDHKWILKFYIKIAGKAH